MIFVSLAVIWKKKFNCERRERNFRWSFCDNSKNRNRRIFFIIFAIIQIGKWHGTDCINYMHIIAILTHQKLHRHIWSNAKILYISRHAKRTCSWMHTVSMKWWFHDMKNFILTPYQMLILQLHTCQSSIAIKECRSYTYDSKIHIWQFLI